MRDESDQSDETRSIFLEEMAELLLVIEADLLQLESVPAGRGLVDRLFRNLHTIKGGAGMAGLDSLSKYTHAVENLLDEVRKGAVALSSDLISLLLEALDCLKGYMAEAHGEAPLDTRAVATSHEKILGMLGTPGAPPLASSPADGSESGDNALPPLQPSLSHPSPEADLNTFIIQVSPQPDFFPLPSELEATVSQLQALGDLLTISHEHSLPPEEKRRPEQHYLWRSFHLVTEAGEATLRSVLDHWIQQHKVELLPLNLLPEAPENQAQIDAAVDGVNHDALSPAVPTPSQPHLPPVSPLPVSPLQIATQAHETTAATMNKLPAPMPADHSTPKLSSIRVDTSKLDKLVNLVGELITVEARLDRFHQQIEDTEPEMAEELLGILDDNSRNLRELQDQAMTIRMVPIGGAFDPMQRLVRDYCRETGKRIQLQIKGRDTEVDKKVFEQISGPLKHLVRNAIDHGIEPPALRAASGKSEDGQITLAASQQFGLIVIEVSDDGRGIDVAKVIASAREKGIIGPEETLTEREGLELIFAPSVSTAESITAVSGRGVGMDVVKRDIEALQGQVDIRSQLGQGTTISVRIPLTLSIVEGMLVMVGQHSFVIPLSMVEECIELSTDFAYEKSSKLIEIRDNLIAFLCLRDLFEIPGSAPPLRKMVIVSSGEQRIGLVVDALLGNYQTVIKPLSKLHKDVQCFMGATLLGNGQVGLILDVLHLVSYGQQQEETYRGKT